MLDTIKTKLTEEEKHAFERLTIEAEIKEALKKTKNGKSPGIDGITYEFYKSWLKKDEEAGEPDIIKILAKVHNDVEIHRVVESSFTIRVMYLLYKKKK
jgi:hypothetical protein